MPTPSLSIDSSTTAASSNMDHHKYLNQQIESWWEKNRDQHNLENHVLTEPDDYQVIINDKSAFVKCCCNQKINTPLPTGRKHYQLSNFYKHLTQNGQCTAIERKRARTESDSDDDSIESFSPSSSSNPPSRFHAKTTTEDNQQSMKLNNNLSHSISKHKRHRK